MGEGRGSRVMPPLLGRSAGEQARAFFSIPVAIWIGRCTSKTLSDLDAAFETRLEVISAVHLPVFDRGKPARPPIRV